MDLAPGGPPKVFLSYSHDSEEHSARVLRLSNRLRGDGIDCDIDAYEMAPPSGWPRWMQEGIAAADFVLVVCTETYLRRLEGRERPGVGLGATWEGAIITQAMYDSGGKNSKFIPVAFSNADLEYRPAFLRTTTYYVLGSETGYEELYRRLTSQPNVLRPQLGELRTLTPTSPSQPPADAQPERPDVGSLALITTNAGQALVVADKVEIAAEITMTLHSLPGSTGTGIQDLRLQDGTRVGFAFGTTGVLARVAGCKQVIDQGRESWQLQLVSEDSDYGMGFMEMATSTYSAEDIAVLRARRLLLDERRPATGSRTVLDNLNSDFFELLIRGQNTPIQITESPFPGLYRQYHSDPKLFLAVARLTAVLMLRLGGVVETIAKLELRVRHSRLAVSFVGRRARKYQNVEPFMIKVDGECQLESTLDEKR